MTYRALLIGNSVFDSDASLNPLNAPTKDVARLHRALVQPETGLFADENVRLITERTSDDILDELDLFFSAAQRDDLLLLYYSGHGLLDERNHLYLCGRTTRSDRLLRTAVSNVRINEFLQQSVATCTVIILDCCSSGMFKGGDLGTPLAGPGRLVVSSSRGRALANDAATPTGTSLFTECLVAGMLGGADDRDHDGFVDLREIFDYVRDTLTATSKQIPHCRFDGDAAVKLARRPVASQPRPTSREPVFALSEYAIVLRDIHPAEQLAPEVVEIYPLAGEPLDCEAETSSPWLRPQIQNNRVIVHLDPFPGPNRGKILIRDRRSRTVQTLRVEAHVTLPPTRPKDDTTVPPTRPAEPSPDTEPSSPTSGGPPSADSTPSQPQSTPRPGREGPRPPRSASQPRARHGKADGSAASRPASPFADQPPAAIPKPQPPAAIPKSAERLALTAFVLSILAIPLSASCFGLLGVAALALRSRAAAAGPFDADTPLGKRLRITQMLSWVSIGIAVVFLVVALILQIAKPS